MHLINVTFVGTASGGDKPVALPVYPNGDFGSIVPKIAKLAMEAASEAFARDSNAILDIHADEESGFRHILLAGTGDQPCGREIGGALVGRLLTSGTESLVVDATTIAPDRRAEFATKLAHAAMLRSWRHDTYRTRLPEKQRPSLTDIEIVVGDRLEETLRLWEPLAAAIQGVALTRELVTEPGNLLYPETFVERCRHLEALGVRMEVLDEARMGDLGMGALLGVSRGSARDARLLSMTWDGTGGTAEPVAFVGKGVTFDTGGISIKPSAGMEAMKWDMAGAGAVAGLIKTLALRKANAHVIGVCALAENMPDGNAMRPGDILTSMSGQTIEVINTDAEGRLVLCDAITWVQRTHNARTIVDVATLTGAIIGSLGSEYAGLFSSNDDLATALMGAGETVAEKLWRMPLAPAFDKLIDSAIADMKNMGPSAAGATTAAQFLARFVEPEARWAHLDIAGVAWSEKPAAIWEAGATGYGVQLLNEFVRMWCEKAMKR